MGLKNNFEIVYDIAEEFNLDQSKNELSDEELSDEFLDNTKMDIEKKDYELGNNYKIDIENFEKKFSFKNIEYMDLNK